MLGKISCSSGICNDWLRSNTEKEGSQEEAVSAHNVMVSFFKRFGIELCVIPFSTSDGWHKLLGQGKAYLLKVAMQFFLIILWL